MVVRSEASVKVGFMLARLYDVTCRGHELGMCLCFVCQISMRSVTPVLQLEMSYRVPDLVVLAPELCLAGEVG